MIKLSRNNISGLNISARYNRYMGAVMIDVSDNNEIVVSGKPIRGGVQSIYKGIMARVDAPENRYYGDTKDLTIEIFKDCQLNDF